MRFSPFLLSRQLGWRPATPSAVDAIVAAGKGLRESGEVRIWWDAENLRLLPTTSPASLVNVLRQLALRYGPLKQSIRAYRDLEFDFFWGGHRDALFKAGVETIDCPHHGKKEVVDAKISADIAAFVRDHPPPATIMVLSSDRGFAQQLSEVANLGYNTTIIADTRDREYFQMATTSEVFFWDEILAAADSSKLDLARFTPLPADICPPTKADADPLPSPQFDAPKVKSFKYGKRGEPRPDVRYNATARMQHGRRGRE